MATIETRTGSNGKITYRAKVRLKGQKPRSKTFYRKTDAVKWAKAIETDLDRGHYVPTSKGEKRTVAELIDRYVKDTLPYKPRNKDYKKTAALMKWWRKEIGEMSIVKVTPATIAECRDKLASEKISKDKTRGPATVNRYLAAMSHAFNTAVKEWFWLPDSPMRNIKRKQEPKGRIRFLTDAERKRLLKVCKEHENPYIYTIVVLALSTGARSGEILSLKWSQVDTRQHKITLFDTKNDETRVLPLHGLAHELMVNHKKVRRIDTDLVFPGEKGNIVFIRRIWAGILKDARIENFRFHDLRHSAASYLAMNGATLTEIADILGHKTLQMVKRYSHLTEQHTSRVVEKMNSEVFK